VKAEIYCQSFNGFIEVEVDSNEEYLKIICTDCDGTGVFEITPQDKQKCNNCKTSGFILVNLI
jgi:DnaJ-class molecular chaperone